MPTKHATRAAKLADGALAGFRQAHGDLTTANELLDKAIAEHDVAASEHLQAKHAAVDAKFANVQVINKLADFIGG